LGTCLEVADFFFEKQNFGEEVAEKLWKDLATVLTVYF
jgi:hypothetical protein